MSILSKIRNLRNEWNMINPGYPATHVILGYDEESTLCGEASIIVGYSIFTLGVFKGQRRCNDRREPN